MKVGIIRCRQTEDACPGTKCFEAIRLRTGAFSGVEEDVEIVGFTTCGGCPGKKAVFRARDLVARGADTIVFASCITKGTPIGYPCPFAKRMISFTDGNLDEGVRILEHSHAW
ncbi:CGGC domain-containing protein [Adlercreutzia sp. ZJ242]|uniref:CGGC domain-containing protein n=1 Tax=Adlercreutzia sp. ZJ242 TaxID=2709409 RepID=UPI0013ED8409|nr:CGGC domain-containing protein [Adlercreutzia sp. ZJ242]